MLLGLETFSYLPWCDRAVVDSVAHVRELDRRCTLDASAALRQPQNLEESTGS